MPVDIKVKPNITPLTRDFKSEEESQIVSEMLRFLGKLTKFPYWFSWNKNSLTIEAMHKSDCNIYKLR